MTNKRNTKNITKNTIIATLAGLVVVIPFIVLEWINTSGFTQKEFPTAIFTFMWLNVGLFVFTLISLVKNVREGVLRTSLIVIVPKVVFLIILALGFTNLVADQLPCFLGVPNCD
jgi:hypothetical protein